MVFIIPWSSHSLQLVYRNSNISLYRTWLLLRFIPCFSLANPFENPRIFQICLWNTGYLVRYNSYYLIVAVISWGNLMISLYVLFISLRVKLFDYVSFLSGFYLSSSTDWFWVYSILEIGVILHCINVITCLSYDW